MGLLHTRLTCSATSIHAGNPGSSSSLQRPQCKLLPTVPRCQCLISLNCELYYLQALLFPNTYVQPKLLSRMLKSSPDESRLYFRMRLLLCEILDEEELTSCQSWKIELISNCSISMLSMCDCRQLRLMP